MDKLIFTMFAGDAGASLAMALAHRMGVDPAEAERLVLGGSVYLDGRRERDPDFKVRPGHRLVVRRPEEAEESAREQDLTVAFKDASLAVVVKPAGMPCGATRRGGALDLEQIVARKLGRAARLLHRLDRVTSGLLLVSLAPGKARTMLAAQVKEHRAARRYLALACGGPAEGEQITLDAPLAMERGLARPSSDPRAREAITRVESLASAGGRRLLLAEPLTGRTHQIRAHLTAAGWPIVGDARYGGPEGARVCLHAHALGFELPSGGWVDVHCPMPAGMQRIMEEER